MQDKAIAAIGRLALQKAGEAEPYQLYVQNMFPGVNYDVLLAVFSLEQEDNQLKCRFEGVDMEKVSDNSFKQYLYRGGSSRGGDITFTTKAGDLSKKLNTLLTVQLKNVIALCRVSGSQTDLALLLSLQECLKSNYNQILTDLLGTYNQLDKKRQQSSGFSLCFESDGERKYLADFPIFQQQILLSGTSGKSEKYGVTSEGANQTCSVCMQHKPLLHGFASPFKYATVDKPGMVSGFFDQKGNWKNYPICPDCSLEFEYGQKYVTQQLKRYFYGRSYYAIPKTVLSKDKTGLDKAIRVLNSLQFQIKEAEQLRRSEDALMQMIGQEENYFTLNLLFFEENATTKAIKIKLLLEEVLPSRFRKLFSDAPAVVNKHVLYKNAYKVKQEPQNLTFSFGILKTFFEDDFYGIINDVFVGRPINKETLYSRVMAVIRANYNKAQTSDGYVEPIVLTLLKAHMVLHYLLQLNLISYNQTFAFSMEQPEDQQLEKRATAFDPDKFKRFVYDNKLFLDDDYKIGVFAVGILVRLLLNIQYNELKNTPFEKKLKGYHLNPDLLKSIYLEALEKISQYRDFYRYGALREIINQYFTLNSYKLPKISNNELSFYFVAGIEFGSRFKTEQVQDDNDKTQL